MIDLILVILAAWFGLPMLYTAYANWARERGRELPPFRERVRPLLVGAVEAWHVALPVLELVGYAVGRVLAPRRERPRPALLAYGEPDDDDRATDGVVGAVAATATGLAKPIATPQNGNNDAVVIAALARLVAAGKVGQTDAIKLGLQVAPSSTSVRYAEARNALRTEVERVSGGPQFNLTPEQVEWRKRFGLEDAA